MQLTTIFLVENDGDMGRWFKVPAKGAFRPPRPFGHDSTFAILLGIDRHDPARLAEAVSFENNCFSLAERHLN
jgi:hypothetical protein